MTAVFVPSLPTLTGGESRSAKDYGAKGDNSTDDTVAIQAALNACNPGGGVILGPGTYVVDALTFPRSGVTLAGSGRGVTTLSRKLGVANAPMLSGSGVSNCAVRDLSIDGQGASQSWWNPNPYTADGVVHADNIRFTDGDSNVVENVTSIAAGRAGVAWFGSTRGLIQNVWGASNGFGSVAIYRNGANECTGTRVEGGGGDSDYCDILRVVSNDVTVAGFRATNALHHSDTPDQFAGVYLESCRNVVVTGCICTGNSNRGIDANDSTATGYTGTYDCVVAGNVCYGHANGGIMLGTANFSVTGNVCYDNTTGGIQCRGARHSLVGNHCHGTQTYGVTAAGTTTYLLIASNQLHANTTGGISSALTSDTGYTASGNIV